MKLRSKRFGLFFNILICTLICAVAFQNCSNGGFFVSEDSNESGRFTNTYPSLNTSDESWFKGEAAWKQGRQGGSCVACHNSIDSTNKRGKSLEQITHAFTSITSMKNIIISDDEIKNIYYALNSPRPIIISETEKNTFKFSCSEPEKRGVSNRTGRRLSEIEMKNTLTDLFGTGIMNSSAVAGELYLYPRDSHEKSERFIPTISAPIINSMTNLAWEISSNASTNSIFISKYATGCTALTTEACIRSFLTNFGSRALRKPLPATELNLLVNAYKAEPSVVDGSALIMAILLRIDFLYHLEIGEISGSRIKLNPYEVAARISFNLTSSIPDDELWSAAKKNELSTLVQLRPHVERLIDTSRSRDRVKKFFREWMEVKDQTTVGVSNSYRSGVTVASYYNSAVDDFNQFIDYLVWDKKAYFASLFLDTTVFPKTSDIASIYGTSTWVSGVGLSNQKGYQGILLRPASLIGGNNYTPIIKRGVKIRREILCNQLIQPSQDEINARGDGITEDELNHQIHSNRVVVGNLTKNAMCMTCHAKINPLGFALEGFDSLGRIQTSERVFNSNDQQIATHPITTASDYPEIEDGGKTRLTDAVDLNSQILESYSVKSCMAEKITRFNYMRTIASEDNCVLFDKEKIIRNPNASIREIMIQNVLNEDIFWKGME